MLTKGDILLERDDPVEWPSAEEADEAAADGQEDNRSVDVQDERSGPGDRVGNPQVAVGVGEIVFGVVLSTSKEGCQT